MEINTHWFKILYDKFGKGNNLFIFFCYCKPYSEFCTIAPFQFKLPIQLFYKGSYQLHAKTMKVFNIKIIGNTNSMVRRFMPMRILPFPVRAKAVAAGKIRAVGVSNYSADEMRLAHAELAKHGIPLASNQVQYSLLHRQPETNGVLDACRELGVTLIAYQPLASGALTGKYLAETRPSGLRRFMPYFRGKNRAMVAPVVALLREIGERYSKVRRKSRCGG